MNIKIARIKKKWSQSELCRRAGIGLNTLVKLEKDDFSSLKYPLMLKLSEVLEIPVQKLFFN